MGKHADATGVALHVPGYIQDTDPGAVGADIVWIDTSGGTGKWISKIRNSTNDGWEDFGKTPLDVPVIPHYSKGTGPFNVLLHMDMGVYIYGGTTVKISAFDCIKSMQGGVSSPSYTFFVRDSAGSYGAGNSDPTAEYVTYTTEGFPHIIYVKVSDGTTTTTEYIVQLIATADPP